MGLAAERTSLQPRRRRAQRRMKRRPHARSKVRGPRNGEKPGLRADTAVATRRSDLSGATAESADGRAAIQVCWDDTLAGRHLTVNHRAMCGSRICPAGALGQRQIHQGAVPQRGFGDSRRHGEALSCLEAEHALGEASGYPRLAASFGGGGTPQFYMGTFPAFLSAWGPVDNGLRLGAGRQVRPLRTPVRRVLATARSSSRRHADDALPDLLRLEHRGLGRWWRASGAMPMRACAA